MSSTETADTAADPAAPSGRLQVCSLDLPAPPEGWVDMLHRVGLPGDGEEFHHLVVPDARVNLLFLAAEDEWSLPVLGLQTEPIHLDLTPYKWSVNLCLRPAATRAFFDADPERLVDRTVSLEKLWGGPAVELGERLFQAGDDVEAVTEAVRGVLDERAAAAEPVDEVTAAAAQRMEESGGALPVSRVAGDIHVSERHLRRLFRRHIGVSPKTYQRLVRFDRALAEVVKARRPVRWRQVARRLGFSDQPHLVREFARYTGMTPERVVAKHIRCNG